MPRIKLTADSTCDLSKELLEKYQISLFPLYIMMGGKSYKDGVDITPADIFAHVESGGELCATSAGSIEDYASLFSRFASEYDAVIHIDIGSEFSCSYQNAAIASREFQNVYVVDSCNLSSGHGHVVVEAGRMIEAGMEATVIVDELNDLTGRVEASFLLERLDYMVKGGRCSAVTAFGANLLNLKPCIEVVNGKMQVGKKYRGSFEKCIEAYVSDRLKNRPGLEFERIFITHPAAPTSAVETARNAIHKYASFQSVIETRAGCTVSCHCGPHTLGILFIRSK